MSAQSKRHVYPCFAKCVYISNLILDHLSTEFKSNLSDRNMPSFL